jgi:hypothetical protein
MGPPGPGEVACNCPTALVEDVSGDDSIADPTKSDTVRLPAPAAPLSSEAAEPLAAHKPCALCGRELAGHRRYRDSRGYICPQCAKSEEEDRVAGLVTCPQCRKKLKKAGLVTHAGRTMCRRCQLDLQESKKVLVHKIASKHFDLHERRTLIVLVGILLFLLIFMILSLLKTHHWP